MMALAQALIAIVAFAIGVDIFRSATSRVEQFFGAAASAVAVVAFVLIFV